jgi:hypothetical protein
MRTHLISAWLCGTLIAAVSVAACGDKGGRGHNTAADASGAADTTPGADGSATADGAQPGADAPTGGCSETDLEACEYASRGLEYDEFDGIATTEPLTGRALPLYARVPKADGPLPVAIWSHGGGFITGGQLHSEQWGNLLASHGYVTIHIGHSPLPDGGGAKYCEVAKVPDNECVPGGDDDANGLLAIGRSFDVVAVLDDLPRLSDLSVAKGGPAFDLDRVVVAGWSGGARGPMMVMGAKVLPTPGSAPFSNPHALPVAALFMSPAGPPFAGWYDDGADSSWSEMRGPTFGATGTNDVKPDKTDLTGDIRRIYFPLQPHDDVRWLLYSNLPVGVGGHGSFNLEDAASSDERLSRLNRAISSAARAFLDASVDGDEGAKAWLGSHNAKVLAGDASWEIR